jgi:hypothetical protein
MLQTLEPLGAITLTRLMAMELPIPRPMGCFRYRLHGAWVKPFIEQDIESQKYQTGLATLFSSVKSMFPLQSLAI